MLRLVSCALRDPQYRALLTMAETTAAPVRWCEVFENYRQSMRGVIDLLRDGPGIESIVVPRGNQIVVGDDFQLRLGRGQNRRYSSGKKKQDIAHVRGIFQR